MKLNYDCVRDVLLFLEENLSNKPLKIRNIAHYFENKYSFDEVVYVFQKLTEVKFIKILTPVCTHRSVVKEITFSGHQFLEKIKPISTWNKIKNIALEAGVLTFSSILDIVKTVVGAKA